MMTSRDCTQSQEIKVVGDIFVEKSLVYILLNYMKCWRGQSPQIMGLHNSIMEFHNSIHGAPLQIMQLYMNYAAPSPFTEARE